MGNLRNLKKRKLVSGDVWCVRYQIMGPNGKRIQKWHVCRHPDGTPMSEEEAKAEQARIQLDIYHGTYIDPSKLSLGAYLEQWLDYRKPNIEDLTYVKYERIIRTILQPSLGHIILSKLQPIVIQQFIGEALKNGSATGGELSGKTVKDIHGVLRTALTHAVKLQLIPFNPAALVDPPKVHHKMAKSTTEEQRAILLELAEKSLYRIPILIALATGLRRAEICALKWEDYDEDRRCIVVRQSFIQLKGEVKTKGTKTDNIWVIGIPPSLVTILKEQREWQKNYCAIDQGWICTHPDGTPFTPNALGHGFARLAKKAKISDISLHSLRHTQGTELLYSGVPSDVVSKRLGHSTIAITHDIYSHAMLQHQEQAIEVAERLINPKKPKIRVVKGESVE